MRFMDFVHANPIIIYAFRVICATLCGALVGLERTKRSKEAGIRTHCIIAGAAALIMVVSKYGFADLGSAAAGWFPGTRGADPARIAAQVVSGISFIGAGVIFKNGNTVKGLTTAAGIWATAAVGLAFGSGMYYIAVFVTLLVLVVQLLMHRFNIGNDAYSNSQIHITMKDSPEIRAALREKQEELGITITGSRITSGDDDMMTLVLEVRTKGTIPFEEVVAFMDAHPDIKSMSI